MEKKITPTLTLAQLYEAQKQYFDAFTIYNILYQSNPSEEILNKKNSVEKRIFNDSNLEYNKIIDLIFTLKDKENFKILPSSKFSNFKEAMENDNYEIIVFEPDEFVEQPEEDYETEEISDEYKTSNLMASEEHHLELEHHVAKTRLHRTHEKNKTTDEKNLMNLTISEFSDYLIKKLNKDKKISELTLKEIKEIKHILQDFI